MANGGGLRFFPAVLSKDSGGGEFPQFMPHHILRDIDRDEFISIMDSKGMTHKFRRDCGTSSPGADYLPLSCPCQLQNFFLKFRVYIRTFFQGTGHFFFSGSGRRQWQSTATATANCYLFYYFFPLLFTIYRSESFFFLVFFPLAKSPVGLVGCRPPELFPSPPPMGWS